MVRLASTTLSASTKWANRYACACESLFQFVMVPRFHPKFIPNAAQAVSFLPQRTNFRQASLVDGGPRNPFNNFPEFFPFGGGSEVYSYVESQYAFGSTNMESTAGLSVLEATYSPFCVVNSKRSQVQTAGFYKLKVCIRDSQVVRSMFSACALLAECYRSFSVEKPTQPARHKENGFVFHRHLYSNIFNPVEVING